MIKYLFFLILLIASPLEAQETLLSWAEAVELATAKNASLSAARSSVEGAELRLKASRWQLIPQLSANLNWGREGRAGITQDDGYSATLGLKQSIFDASIFGSIAENSSAKRLQDASLVVERVRLSRDLKNGFAGVLYAQSAVELSNSIIERRQQNLNLVLLRYEGGRENGGSVALARAYLEEAKLEKVQAENAFVFSGTTLRALIGNDEISSLTVSGEPPMREPPSQVNFDELLLRAPERMEALYVEEQNQAKVKTAKGKLLPSLSFNGNLGRYGDRFFPQENGWSVGLTLSIPFGNFTNYQSLGAARAEAVSASYKRSQTERDIRTRLVSTFNAYSESEKSLQVAERFLNATKTRAEIARKKYETGLISFDEWDRIENDLISRETAALRAKRDRISAEVEWEYLIGEGSI